jgi:hypothetical protein
MQRSNDELLEAMISRGYIVKAMDGKFSPSEQPPPDNEEEELKAFWAFLKKKAQEKREQN